MSEKSISEHLEFFGRFRLKTLTKVEREYQDKIHLHTGEITSRRLLKEFVREQLLIVQNVDTAEMSEIIQVSCEIPHEIVDAIIASKDPIALTTAIASIV